MEYHLCAEIEAHKGAVRGVDVGCINDKTIIVSGGLDGLVLSWRLVQNDNLEDSDGPISLSRITELAHHPAPVYSVAVHSSADAIYSGSQQGTIVESGFHGGVQGKFHGHTKPVNSLAIWGSERIVSGCWDATARVWSTQTRECTAVLEGPHSHAVAVAAVDNDRVLTGSQNGKLVLWKADCVVQEINSAHSDIIRAISTVINWTSVVVTCSNDGFVRLWLIQEGGLKRLEFQGTTDTAGWAPGGTSDVLLFDARGYKLEDGPLLLVAAGDDGSLRVGTFAESGEGLALLSDELVWTHISSVWAARFLPAEDVKSSPDIVAACGDGFVRNFTANPQRAMKAEKVQNLRAQSVATAIAAKAQQSGGSLDISKLPRISEKASIRGKMAGQVKMFVNGPVVEIHQWTGSEWQKVGDMVAPTETENTLTSSTQVYEGDDFFPPGPYDYVFHVDIESNNSRSKLPFRLGDNPMEVAERFCARERIGKHNVPDIIKFIEANTGIRSVSNPPRSTAPPPPIQSNAPEPPAQEERGKYNALQNVMPTKFPAGTKWDKPLEKIIELNRTQEEDLKLKAHEIPNLMTLKSALEQPVFDKEKIGTRDLAMFLGKHAWNDWQPKEALFPMFDILRKIACNNMTADYFRRHVKGRENVTFVIEFSKSVGGIDSTSPVSMLIFRYLANISSWASTRDYFVQDTPHIIGLLRDKLTPPGKKFDFSGPTAKNTLGALLGFLMNVGIGISANARSALALSSQSARQHLRKAADVVLEYTHDLLVNEHGCVKQSGDLSAFGVCLVLTGLLASTVIPNEPPSPRLLGLCKEVERVVTPLLESPTLVQVEAAQAINEFAK